VVENYLKLVIIREVKEEVAKAVRRKMDYKICFINAEKSNGIEHRRLHKNYVKQ